MGQEGRAIGCRNQLSLETFVAHEKQQFQVSLHNIELMSQLWQSPEVRSSRGSASCTPSFFLHLHGGEVVLNLLTHILQCLFIGAARWFATVHKVHAAPNLGTRTS